MQHSSMFHPSQHKQNNRDNNLNQKSQKRAAILAILRIQDTDTLERAASRLCISVILDLILQGTWLGSRRAS